MLAAGIAVAAAAGVVFWATRDKYHLPEVAQRAEDHLRARGTAIDPAMVLILHYLDRRFTLEWVRPLVARVRDQHRACVAQPASDACRAAHATGTFARLVDPSARVTAEQLASLPNTLDGFTASALYCKVKELPQEFPALVAQRLVKENDYDPPHAALALQWAIEQGCLDLAAPDVARVHAQILDALVDVAAGVPQDSAIEAVALLAYTGGWSRVQSAWLQTIAAAQTADGGWGERAQAPSNDHTSTLALWVLLEATREGKMVNWVPQ